MADQVIRDAVIRLSLQVTDNDKFKRALEDNNKLADEANRQFSGYQDNLRKATEQQDKLRNTTVQLTEASNRLVEGTNQLGEGAFRAARGFAFLAASNADSAQEMLRTVAIAQGAFDTFAGGLQTVRSLSQLTGIALGPIGTVAIPAITTALTVGAAVWRQWGDEAEDAATRAKRAAEEASRALDEAIARQNRLRGGRDEVRGLLGPGQRLADIQDELSGTRFRAPAALADVLTAEREIERAQSQLLAGKRIRERFFLAGDPSAPTGAAEIFAAQRTIEAAQARRQEALARAQNLTGADIDTLGRRRELFQQRFGVVSGDIRGRIGDQERARREAESAARQAAAEIERQQDVLGGLPARPVVGSPAARARGDAEAALADAQEARDIAEGRALQAEVALGRLTQALEDSTSTMVELLRTNTQRADAAHERAKRLEQAISEGAAAE